jgi:tyrosyl-tRNA synthetase
MSRGIIWCYTELMDEQVEVIDESGKILQVIAKKEAHEKGLLHKCVVAELIVKYFEMCTDVSGQEIEEIKKSLADGSNPRDAKMRLAREIINLYDSEKEAQEAEQEFINIFQKHEIPDDMEEMQLGSESMNIIELLMITKLASSKSEARRLIDGGGVRIDNEKVGGWEEVVNLEKEKIVQVGRRKFVKVRK